MTSNLNKINIYEILNEQNEVINRIVAEQWFVDKYYPGQYRLEEDTPEVEPEPSPIITVLQLRRLFTFQEKLAVEQAIQNGNAALKVFMDDLLTSSYVDLTDPLVNQGLEVLVQSEIITPERKTEILEYRIVPDEMEPEPDKVITVLQLRRLFSIEEKIAFEQAISDGNLAIKVLMDDLAASEYVDLSDPLVTSGLDLLVQQNFLTRERVDQILNNEEPDA